MGLFNLVNIDEISFGFWESSDFSLESVPILHSLPLMPEFLAGVALEKGKTVSFGDLAVFLGQKPLNSKENLNAIIFSAAGESTLGFVWQGNYKQIELDKNQELELPFYLQTQLIDSCIVDKNTIIPVINIKFLQAQLRKGKIIDKKQQLVISSPEKITVKSREAYLFSCAKEEYALEGALVEEIIKMPAQVRQLPHLPDYVKGVILHREKLIPLITLRQRLKIPQAGIPVAAAILRIDNFNVGILLETLPKSKTVPGDAQYCLPPICKKAWLNNVLQEQEELIPFIAAEGLFSEESKEENPFEYNVSEEFSRQFLKEDVEVLEFSLFGIKHAVPKGEVVEIIDYTKARALPLKFPLLLGINCRNHEIIPVLDMARCFNIASLANENWKLLHIKNGDFQALILSERVFGERVIPLNDQRELPLVLPYPLVYGCYTSEDRINLVLNIWALTVYFDKEEARDFYKALFLEFVEVYLRDQSLPQRQALKSNYQEESSLGSNVYPENKNQEIDDKSGKPALYKAKRIHKTRDKREHSTLPLNPKDENITTIAETPPNKKVIPVGKEIRKRTLAGGGKADIPPSKDTPLKNKKKISAGGVTMVSPRLKNTRRGSKKIFFAKKARLSLFVLFLAGIIFLGIYIFALLNVSPYFLTSQVNLAIKQVSSLTDTKQKETPPAMSKPGTENEVVNTPGFDYLKDEQKTTLSSPRNNESPYVEKETIIYKIKWGDTLAHIARDFTGNPYNYPSLAQENKIKNPHFILAGDTIRITVPK
jgi:chemotaxis signal transduction protein